MGVVMTHLKRAHERLINTHHGARIFKLATVVGRREDCHQLPLGKEFIALLDHLCAAVWRGKRCSTGCWRRSTRCCTQHTWWWCGCPTLPLPRMHVSCLVRPAHKVQVMLLQEVSNTVWPKRVAHATVVLAPALDVLVRVCPQQVAQQPAAAAAVTAAAQAAAATALSLHKQIKAAAAAVALETDKQPAKLWGSINEPIKRHTRTRCQARQWDAPPA